MAKFKIGDTAICEGERVVILDIISEEDDEFVSLYEVWSPGDQPDDTSVVDDYELSVDDPRNAH